LFAVRGVPEHLRSDNGPEFVAHAVTRWLYRAGVKTLFIAKGSPWENGYVESFNSRFGPVRNIVSASRDGVDFVITFSKSETDTWMLLYNRVRSS
jgi:transposase InsO family protein